MILHPAKTYTGGAHAPLGPSSAKRWLSCARAGRLAIDEPPADSGNNASMAGTIMHSAFEAVLRGRPEILTESEIDDLDVLDFGRDYCWTIVTKAVEAVTALVDRFQIEQLWLEERIYSGRRWNRDDLWGTADVIGFSAKSGTLLVADLKSGRWKVDPVLNDQMLIYALGAIDVVGADRVQKVELAIIQPNPATSGNGLKVWSTDVALLAEFAAYVGDRLAVIDNGPHDAEPGEHCTYCPSSRGCPAR